MSKQDLVSVVIPCYNQAGFLRDAIDSVLTQRGGGIELIVVDDGSTDATAETAGRYPAVRCLQQRRSGVAVARNLGLRESNGAYLVFLDADDRLLPGALEIGVDTLRAQPDFAFVFGSIELITMDGVRLPTPTQRLIERDHYLELLRHNYIWTSGAVMYRRAVLQAVGGFNTSVGASADLELNLRIARRFPIHCHGRIVLEYRRHSSNMTGDCGLMLEHAVRARRLHHHYVAGQSDYEQALEDGIRVVQKDYGEKLALDIRTDIKQRRWWRAAKKTLTLARYYPRRIWNAPLRRLYGLALKRS
jgi:glycosyltransferase involved in cell wall biosynthesis